MTEKPEDIVKRWEARLAGIIPAATSYRLVKESVDDIRSLVERNKTGFWDLPPLPDYPGARIVIDCPEGQLAHQTIIQAGIDGEFVTLAGKFVRALFKVRPPEPIPDRTERALHLALGCCDAQTGECDGVRVRQAWEESK